MSSIIVAAVFTGVIIAICLLVIAIANKQKEKKMNQLMKRFSELGTAHNLSFSSQEVFNNSVIGLDGINRTLLILTHMDNISVDDYVVGLDEVKNCTVKKYYGNIKPGDLKKRKLQTFLERIALRFEFNDGKDPVEAALYNHTDNHGHHPGNIEKKARQWQQILSKMLKRVKNNTHPL
jgi:hypothetical protein